MPPAVFTYPGVVDAGSAGSQVGLLFDPEGAGVILGAPDAALTFPQVLPENLGDLFPTYIPNVETLVYQTILEATQVHGVFPENGFGLALPFAFNVMPDIALFDGVDPAGRSQLGGRQSQPIPVVQGWPTYPGAVPAIGVAMGTENEDAASKLGAGGFAGDAVAVDDNGNQLASAAYYAEPLYSPVVVELIHENRDERDRLHNQLRRILYPLRHLLPASSPLIKEVAVAGEKQELPIDEQPLTIYASIFTVEVWSEALIPTDIAGAEGFIGAIDVTVNPIGGPDSYVNLT